MMGIAIASYRDHGGVDRFFVQPGDDVQITFPKAGVMPDKQSESVTIVDFYESKMSEYDSTFVFVPIAHLQELLGMIDPATKVGNVSTIQIKLKPGVDPETVRPVVERLFKVYLNLKLGEVNFKELTYDLAEVVYEYPFRLPANFTYIMRALMTLEGIGIVTDPAFSFFETAKPYAKEFMLRREGRKFGKLILDTISGRENGNTGLAWSRVWKLTKMAAQMYLG